MRHILLAIACGILAASGISLAQHEEHAKSAVKTLSRKDMMEKIDGKQTAATTVEVMLGPGQASAPHRHPGPVFGYVLEGDYEWAIDDNPPKVLKGGDTFYEPTGCLHRVSKNPTKNGKTRILAVVLHPADVQNIVLPEKDKKQ